MNELDFEAFKRAYADVPSQDNEGYTPDRGSFKVGFFAGIEYARALKRDETQDRTLEDRVEVLEQDFKDVTQIVAIGRQLARFWKSL